MLAACLQLLDFFLNLAIIITTTRWAARRTSRARAMLIAIAVAFLYSLLSDFSIGYATPDFDHSLKAVVINAFTGAALGYGISFFVTLRPSPRRPSPNAT